MFAFNPFPSVFNAFLTASQAFCLLHFYLHLSFHMLFFLLLLLLPAFQAVLSAIQSSCVCFSSFFACLMPITKIALLLFCLDCVLFCLLFKLSCLLLKLFFMLFKLFCLLQTLFCLLLMPFTKITLLLFCLDCVFLCPMVITFIFGGLCNADCGVQCSIPQRLHAAFPSLIPPKKHCICCIFYHCK